MVEPILPNQIIDFKLKASYWYVTHKLLLRKILVGFLIFLNLVFYSYSLYLGLLIFVVQDPLLKQDLNQLSGNLIDYRYFHEINRPIPLEILDSAVLGSRDGRFDYILKVRNPNLKLTAAKALFQLVAGSQVMAEKHSFILPGEEKYIAFFGLESSADTAPAIRLAQVNWRRVSNYEDFRQQRFQFSSNEVEFKNAGVGSSSSAVSTLNFKITNQSAYNYWQVGVYMVLFSGDQVVGANYLALDNFKSGETRPVEMRWYESLSYVSRVDIIPEVNILDPAVYMPVE
ncbi:MAG: hypothetical protein A3D39_02640 [Candidatus Buchananbacteria bacterium RIFCSPHIGHO2_02_FULL_39_17]|uniref:Uncharacterized protein n=1 Tax=Candidatus Buchananbacteria bacterium RIFCSPLOWO2_01_FULL_40_23b TaxID=1797544 RepID=A0A1G1YTI8_9BACT|nr:MAG: hypothetical protein A3D39_02640 [Candidatus Buchananbacteria bacterium RIFCSPHIGHO2_02_FULL_39_17]OGY55665.1 MAG: hypothetical protein A2912_05665 [Candidatus Buchananbacteria bacterium RIFCSPLOWO2_01_FULL_40_23b]